MVTTKGRLMKFTDDVERILEKRARPETLRLPVISMWMPWANWVGLGWKTIETRTHRRFQSLAGRQIAIHCAVKWDKSATKAALAYLTPNQVGATERFLKIGGAVCWLATVAEHRRLTPADERAALIECSTERYGLVLTDIRSIGEAIPMKGRQGIWYADLPIRS